MEKLLPGVYALFRGEKIVYIGESNNIYRRISEHTYGRGKTAPPKDFDRWEYVRIENDYRRKELERALISFFDPLYNMTWRLGGNITREDKKVIAREAKSCLWLLASVKAKNETVC